MHTKKPVKYNVDRSKQQQQKSTANNIVLQAMHKKIDHGFQIMTAQNMFTELAWGQKF